MRLQVEVEPKSLGITIDSHLRFDCHTKEVARECNYHARALHHVCTLLTNDLAQTVACSIITSRLDYCNAMLHGAPAATFNVLQRAQNNLARVVCERGGRYFILMPCSLHFWESCRNWWFANFHWIITWWCW